MSADPTMLYWGLGLLGLGVVLIAVELFIPSGGLIAVGAAIAAIAGVVMLFRHDSTWGLIGMLGVVVLGPMAGAFALRVYPNTPLGRKMIYGDTGEDIALEQAERMDRERDAALALLDAEGEALTDLRPVGTVLIEGERVEALAEGDLIELGARVRVTRVEHGQVKVREIS
ncbi:MAG: NfeD family protein [Planctomycetota bacterium]